MGVMVHLCPQFSKKIAIFDEKFLSTKGNFPHKKMCNHNLRECSGGHERWGKPISLTCNLNSSPHGAGYLVCVVPETQALHLADQHQQSLNYYYCHTLIPNHRSLYYIPYYRSPPLPLPSPLPLHNPLLLSLLSPPLISPPLH